MTDDQLAALIMARVDGNRYVTRNRIRAEFGINIETMKRLETAGLVKLPQPVEHRRIRARSERLCGKY